MLASFSVLWKHKSLSSLNLGLVLHDVSIFWLEPDTSGTSFLFLPRYKLGKPPLDVHEHWAKLVFIAIIPLKKYT